MQRESTAAGWVTPDQFADGVALGNALPGPIAPQVSAFIGYQVAGVPGAIVAAAGTVLPTTILMLVMIFFFFRIKDSVAVKSMLTAVRPVVVGLLLWTAYDMAVSVFGVKKLGWGAALSQGWDKLAHRCRDLHPADFHQSQPGLHHPGRGGVGVPGVSVMVGERISRESVQRGLRNAFF